MSAGNLAIVEDASRNAIPPAGWARRPAVPDELTSAQEALIVRGDGPGYARDVFPEAFEVPCPDQTEPDGEGCTGTVQFRPGDPQARCSVCGGWMGREAPGTEQARKDAALREKAIDAAMRVVYGRGHPDFEKAARERARIAEAVDAAGQVYADAEKAYIDEQVAKAGILKMDASGIDVVMARETAVGLALASRTLLDAYAADNYVEQTVWDDKQENRYVITIHRTGGKTPHELRRAAEEEAQKLRTAILHVVNCAGELAPAERPTVFRDEGCGWCTSTHLGELRWALGMPMNDPAEG
jgi:hypothetical protein